MIKIASAHIEEFRGIRKLDINLANKSFAVSGPNGSGKSGVIDAIEFALTGQIGRLTGTGTKGLSLADHGPHVDHIKFPDAAFVELEGSVAQIVGRDSSRESSVVAGRHEQTHTRDVQDPELAGL